jgi:hypothetical protein
MHAAAAGHSTLGIPKKVGKEFAAATHHVSALPRYVSRRKAERTKQRPK